MMKFHTLPDESISMASCYKSTVKDSPMRYIYQHDESFYFDYEDKREVIRLYWYTTLSGNIVRNRNMRVDISTLSEWNQGKKQYDCHHGTKTEYLTKAGDKKHTLSIYRELREKHLNDHGDGWYYWY